MAVTNKLERKVTRYEEGIRHLKSYLDSDKFTGEDTTVQVKDVLTRIAEMESDIHDLDFT